MVFILIDLKGQIGTPAYEPFLFNLFYKTAKVIHPGVEILECVFIFFVLND